MRRLPARPRPRTPQAPRRIESGSQVDRSTSRDRKKFRTSRLVTFGCGADTLVRAPLAPTGQPEYREGPRRLSRQRRWVRMSRGWSSASALQQNVFSTAALAAEVSQLQPARNAPADRRTAPPPAIAGGAEPWPALHAPGSRSCHAARRRRVVPQRAQD